MEGVEARVEDGHRVFAHVVGVGFVLVDEAVRAAVADVLGVGDGGLVFEHVVDEGLGEFLVLAAGRDAEGVDEVVGGLGGVEAEIDPRGLGIGHDEVIPGVVDAGGGLAGFHHVVDLVHDVAFDEGLLLFQGVEGGAPGGGIFGVHIQAEAVLGGAEGVAGIVELEEPAAVFRVPQQFPVAGIGLIHLIGIIDDAGEVEGVGHGVGVVRVVVEAAEAFADVGGVGDVLIIQREEQALGAHAGDHVVGGDDDIVADGAGGDLGVHVLVAGEGGVVELDLVSVILEVPVLEALDGVEGVFRAVGDVFAPVVDVQDRFLGPADDEDADDEDGEDRADEGGDVSPGALSGGGFGRGGGGAIVGAAGAAFDPGAGIDEVGHDEQGEDGEEDDGREGVHLGGDGLLRHVVDADGQGLEAVAGGEVGDDEVVKAQGEGHDGAGDDAGHDLGDLDLEEGAEGGAAQVHRGLGEGGIHLLELGEDLEDDVGQAEGDVRDEHGPEVQAGGGAEEPADEDEHEHEGDAGDDVGVDHGDVRDGVAGGAQGPGAQAEDAHGGGGAHDGGHGGGGEGEDQGIAHGGEGLGVTEELAVPVEGEALHDGEALGGVEGEDEEDGDGGEEEEHDQGRVDFGGGFHRGRPPFTRRPGCWRSAA